MRRWGVIITLFYAAALLVFVVPGSVLLVSTPHGILDFHKRAMSLYGQWPIWICFAVLVLGEVLLLSLTVDTSERRLKPRTRILVSALTTGFLLAVLTVAAVLSVVMAYWGDNAPGIGWFLVVGAFVLPWLFWGIIFARVCRESNDPVSRAAKWLLRGSVLEVLIAIPSHVIVRRKDECCAPIMTGFAISTGIAIMLLSFGPSVLLLYKKRMESLRVRAARVS